MEIYLENKILTDAWRYHLKLNVVDLLIATPERIGGGKKKKKKVMINIIILIENRLMANEIVGPVAFSLSLSLPLRFLAFAYKYC